MNEAPVVWTKIATGLYRATIGETEVTVENVTNLPEFDERGWIVTTWNTRTYQSSSGTETYPTKRAAVAAALMMAD